MNNTKMEVSCKPHLGSTTALARSITDLCRASLAVVTGLVLLPKTLFLIRWVIITIILLLPFFL